MVSFFLTTTLYWSFGMYLTMLESSTQSRKLQPTKPPVTNEKWWKAARGVLSNQVAVGIPMLTAYWYLLPKMGWSNTDPLPTIARLAKEVGVFMVAEETIFYGFHRLFHHKLFYKHVHKQHHEFNAPTAIAAIYAHPVEHVLVNLLPIITGPLLMKSHLTVFWTWISFSSLSAVFSHCGHDLGNKGPVYHGALLAVI